MKNKEKLAFLSEWAFEIDETIIKSNALCLAIFSSNRKLLFSNPAFDLLVKNEPIQSFINPTIEELLNMESSSNLIFDGFLTLGDYDSSNTSIAARVYRKDEKLLVIGGIESLQLIKQNSQLGDLNQEIGNLQRELIKKTNFLETALTKVKETQEAVKVSEKRFRTVLDTSPFAIIVADENYHDILYWNKSATKLFGHTPKTTEEWLQLAYPDPKYRQEIIDHWNPYVKKAQKTKRSINTGEYRIACKDGSNKICELYAQFIPGNLIVSLRDITARKKVEEALLENQKRYSKAQAMGHVGNWEYYPETLKFWGSDEAKKIYGFDMKSQDFTIERVENCNEERERVHQALIDLMEHDKKYDLVFDIITEDKGIRKTIHSIAEATRDAQGNVVKLTGVVSDITKYKKAEYEIMKAKENAEVSEKYLHNIINNIGDPVFVKDEQSKLILVNDAFCNIFKLSREKIIGKTLGEAVPANEQKNFLRIDKHVLRTGEESIIEETLTINGTQTKYISTRKSRYVDHNNKKFIVGIIRDITDLKSAEFEINKLNEDLEQRVIKRTAQLEVVNKELQAFSYSVSHDLKAPLRAITGFSQILVEDYSEQLDDEAKRYLNRVRDNADNMGHLITDLLNLSRTGRVKLNRSQVDLVDVIQRVKDVLLVESTDRDIELKIGELPEVLADETLIYQVILNLLSNAVKFTSRNKQALIEIGSFLQETKRVYFVKDNGVGFDMKYAEKTFEVFHRLHSSEEFSGTGIGLAIVKRIITMHNGNIWVESEKGKGTTFFFNIN